MYETDLQRMIRVVDRLDRALENHPDENLDWVIELLRSDVKWIRQMLVNDLAEMTEES